MTVGAPEILLVVSIVLLLIGPRRIADLGRSLSRGVRDFRLELGRDNKDKEFPKITAKNPSASAKAAPPSPKPTS